MNPNSRSPWAAWFRFMKSMSIAPHGRSRLNCVCRCRKGFWSEARPAIHILAGEKVCIQRTRPTQSLAALAAARRAVISSGVFTTGLKTTRQGIRADWSSAAATFCEFSATCFSVSGP